MDPDFDVVVIGAGLSGLTAARACQQTGLSCAVLEARDRVGGRLWSAPAGNAVFDRGGQWVGPGQPRIQGLIDEFGLTTYPVWHQGRATLELNGRTSTYTGTIPRLSPLKLIRLQMLINKIERLRKTVARDQPWLADRAAEWDSLTVASWIRKQTGMTDVQAMLEPAMRTIFGADSGELSMLHALHYINSCGGLMPLIEIEGGFQERRIDGGAQQVCERLADSVGRDRVLTGVPVREIQQGDRVVTITAGDRSFTARAAIVSVPLAIVDRIHFSSALPVLRSQLTQRVSAGATVKVLLTYERPFWRDQGLSGEAVSTSGPVSVVFDNCSKDDRQAALLAFVVGDPARGWSDQPDQVRQQTVLAFLEKCFGPEVHSYSSLVETDWAAEQWSGGCPTNNYPPGTLSTFGPALRAPAGRIYWAGTETARINTGYMDGAIESGLRAAEEVAVSLGRLGTK